MSEVCAQITPPPPPMSTYMSPQHFPPGLIFLSQKCSTINDTRLRCTLPPYKTGPVKPLLLFDGNSVDLQTKLQISPDPTFEELDNQQVVPSKPSKPNLLALSVS